MCLVCPASRYSSKEKNPLLMDITLKPYLSYIQLTPILQIEINLIIEYKDSISRKHKTFKFCQNQKCNI